jgi:hypothetical protein
MTERARLAGEQEAGGPQDRGPEPLDGAVPAAAIIGGWTGQALAAEVTKVW